MKKLGPAAIAALPSCTKRIRLRHYGLSVDFSLGPSVAVDGREVPLSELPKTLVSTMKPTK